MSGITPCTSNPHRRVARPPVARLHLVGDEESAGVVRPADDASRRYSAGGVKMPSLVNAQST